MQIYVDVLHIGVIRCWHCAHEIRGFCLQKCCLSGVNEQIFVIICVDALIEIPCARLGVNSRLERLMQPLSRIKANRKPLFPSQSNLTRHHQSLCC